MSHSLTPYLTQSITNISGLTKAEVINLLPIGWHNSFTEIIDGLYIPLNARIIGVDIRNGVLYLTKDSSGLTYDAISTYVIRSLSQESAKTCMMCGKFARRRKEQAHKPALCREHYLEYINALED